MASTTRVWLGAAQQKLGALFAEREIFLRSGGHVRFVRISSRIQKTCAATLLAGLIGWGSVTATMLSNQASVQIDRAALDQQARSVAAQTSKVNAYKRSVGDIAADLDRRQDMLDDMVRSQFGGESLSKAVVGHQPDTAKSSTSKDTNKKISSAMPGPRDLRALETRQIAFARQLASVIDKRAQKAEAAIRSFGLNPAQVAQQARAQGGPFVPWSGQDDGQAAAAFANLAHSLARLNALERGLVAIPSGQPTTTPMLTSSYGYRSDPFTGQPAFHAGLDFPGSYGQPILAAATGRVSYVGQRSGYGNVVEIDHGHGIMTRYAHLSGFNAHVGETVTRGLPIARMGSTGRSTGTHLHFEVRVNGAPINPRRFLEATQDVLQVQQIAKQRVANVPA
ncbi:MAG: M23 family metallopeptidase [Sphingobium sp.]